LEESPNALNVEFYYQHTILGTQWEQTWLSSNGVGTWDGSKFYADFNPPYSADTGAYKFMVEITDTAMSSPYTIGDTIQTFPTEFIDVRNNDPIAIDIKTSSDTVRAGVNERVYIHVNASDGSEDPEGDLVISTIEWRESDQGGNYDVVPSGAFNINLNEGYHAGSGGWLIASMIPSSTASKVSYDIQVYVEDTEGGVSGWVELLRAFTVTNPEPLLDDYSLGVDEVFRGGTVYIFVNGSDPDPSKDESDLIVQVQYREKGSSSPWTNLDAQPNDYEGTAPSGYWAIPFAPDLGWDDEDLEDYEFHVRVYNGVAYSNQGDYNLIAGSVLIKNNVPEAKTLDVEDSTVERSSSLLFYATGEDLETDDRFLDAVFEYSIDGGGTWSKSYFGAPSYNAQQSRFEVTFTPDSDADLGEYDFQVRFFDDVDYSDNLIKTSLVEVTNVKPVVSSLSISDSTAYRMDTITLTAQVSDADQDEGTLTPNFQYKGPSGGWISQSSSSSYFNPPSYMTEGKWEIEFEPPADADVGEYSFSVEFTDNEGITSDPYELISALTLENSQPEVTIDKPTSGSRDPGKIKFEATGFDEEDQSLTWLWNFGDGETSTDESPTHEFTEAGSYDITVTVTDDDGDTHEDTVSITIKGDGTGFPLMMLLMILIPLIVVVLVVVLLLTKKKKKPEAVPPPEPEVPAAVPPIPSEPTPAAPPTPAVAAAPPAVPAAAPAGQMIKCPQCQTPFPVTSTERPLTIECPSCGAKGTLK
jgi:chitodextrinase